VLVRDPLLTLVDPHLPLFIPWLVRPLLRLYHDFTLLHDTTPAATTLLLLANGFVPACSILSTLHIYVLATRLHSRLDGGGGSGGDILGRLQPQGQTREAGQDGLLPFACSLECYKGHTGSRESRS